MIKRKEQAMNWTVANQKYCLNNWRVYPTPDGWRIARRKYKEMPFFEEISGMVFDTSRQALTAVERMIEREKRNEPRTNKKR